MFLDQRNRPALLWIVIFEQKIFIRCVPSKEDGKKWDAAWSDPGEDDHHDGRPHGDGGVVNQGLGDGVISKYKVTISSTL